MDTYVENLVAIPKITITMNTMYWPFMLVYRQFLLELSFAMAINKAQAQTMSIIGLQLFYFIFIHKKLYMGLSCARNSSMVFVSFLLE